MMRHLGIVTLILGLAAGPAWSDATAGRRAIDRSDYATALRELQPLAERGDPEAQYQLGRMYSFGWGVKEDKKEADRLYRLAASRGHPHARQLLLKACERDATPDGVAAQNATLRSAPASQVIRSGRTLCAKSAAMLEDRLKANAEDHVARYRLLGYYQFTAPAEIGPARAITARRPHILWLIEHHPDSEAADAPEARLDPTEGPLADPDGYAAGSRLWLQHLERPAADALLHARAAHYHQVTDKQTAEQILLKARTRFPAAAADFNAHLGYLYALATLGVSRLNNTGIPVAASDAERNGPFAGHSRGALQQSQDPALVGTAGKILSQYGAMMMAFGLSKNGEFRLAEQLLVRADKLQPENPYWAAVLGEHLSTVARIGPRAGADSGTLKRALAYMERSLAATTAPDWRMGRLGETAKLALRTGDLVRAERYAGELLALAEPHPGDEKYGPAWHDGHVVLGRIALRRNAPEQAREHLLKAGKSAGGGTLSSFGPDMGLARDLLERGDRQTVLEYLRLCRNFWTYSGAPLERWIGEIEAGQRPNFGGNLHD